MRSGHLKKVQKRAGIMMHVIAFSLALILVDSRSVYEDLVCHRWTAEDVKAMGEGRSLKIERQRCEDVLGYTFTQGQNKNYPNCGGCYCCKPRVFEDLICHHWTAKDVEAMGSGRSLKTERQRCEDVLGYTFTQGQNKNYPNCGGCYCCKPRVYEDLVCYHWTAKDVEAMGSGRSLKTERQRCEDVLGYTFTQGQNKNYPNCGGCYCCKPRVYEDLVCHHWTSKDVEAMGSGRSLKTERQRCEDVLGYTFTQGHNKNYPNCGGCYCCKPRVYEDLVCHHWTAEDVKAMGKDRSLKTERQRCEDVLGYTFTQGQNKKYPNCGGCYCCKPRVYKNLVCHHWTAKDVEAMQPGRSVETERQRCEDVLGYTFTKGQNEKYPNCGGCYCCKPRVYEDLVCHHWTAEDGKAMGPGRSLKNERQRCEDVLGYTYTQGQNKNYPNCGRCYCCKPRVYENLVCHHWTAKDVKAMGSGRSLKTERQRCEDVLGYTFTQGQNKNYPNCGGCYCCKPRVYENLVCHHWTAEDVKAMGKGRTLKTERQRCEDVLGYTFTQGHNKNYPNCGGCYCCKPRVYEDLLCHHWTAEDVKAMGKGRSLKTERQRCEDDLGYTFTQGQNKNYPNCGGCYCCKPRVYEDLVCHHWTAKDVEAMGSGRSLKTERQRCEDVLGYTYTQGQNKNYPNCGGCYCCKPRCINL